MKDIFVIRNERGNSIGQHNLKIEETYRKMKCLKEKGGVLGQQDHSHSRANCSVQCGGIDRN